MFGYGPSDGHPARMRLFDEIKVLGGSFNDLIENSCSTDTSLISSIMSMILIGRLCCLM
jgi:hypothetical protein